MASEKHTTLGQMETFARMQDERDDVQEDRLQQLEENADGGLKYTAQTLDDEQKAQARKNIGAVGENKLDLFIDNTDIDHAYDEPTGAYYTVVRVYRDRLDGTKQYPFVYAPNGTGSGDSSTYDMAIYYGWLMALNAGIFNTSDITPLGMLIQNGTVLQAADTTKTYKSLTIDNQGNLSYAEPSENASDLVSSGIISAVCGFAPIIIDYNPVEETDYPDSNNWTISAQRQIIGQFGNGDYAIVTCEGRSYHNSDGWTIPEAQAICQQLGLKFAYNLDGGGSTETVLGQKQINTIYENTTGRKVPTYIVFNGSDTFATSDGIEYLGYLHVPAGAYINTGISASDLYNVEYKAKSDTLTMELSNCSSAGHIFSSTYTWAPFVKMHPWCKNGETGGYADYYNKTMVFGQNCGNTVGNTNIYDVDKTTPHVIRSEYNDDAVSFYCDDNFVISVSKGTRSETSSPYYLFAYGGNPTNSVYGFTGDFYYLKLWNTDGILVRNFRPARRNGVVGLYDTVTETFYTSDSTIAFTV